MNKIFLLASILLCPIFVRAYDFMDGGFAYDIISETDKLCSLVSTYDNAPSEPDEDFSYTPYSGDIVIPQYATYKGEKYQVYQIGEYAFWRCDSITSLTIPPTLKSIKNDAFYDIWPKSDYDGNQLTAKMTKIIIEDSPESLSLGYRSGGSGSPHALFYPYKVDYVYLGRNLSYYLKSDNGYYGPFSELGIHKIHISDFVTEIPGYLFSYQGRGIEELELSHSISSIGNSAFNQSLNLSIIEIPEGVTTIGSNAFYGNKSLKEVVLPSTLKTIQTYGFSSCSNLSVIYCYALTPPAANGAAYSYDVANARLRVPLSSVEKYKASTFWNNFGEILALDETVNPLPTTYSVSILFPEGGKIWHEVRNGQALDFYIQPNDGWSLYSITLNEEDITSNVNDKGKISTGPIRQDSDVKIIFKDDNYSTLLDIVGASKNSITINGSEIMVNGSPKRIKLYDINGICRYSGNSTTISVPASGVYILDIDGQKFKFAL